MSKLSISMLRWLVFLVFPLSMYAPATGASQAPSPSPFSLTIQSDDYTGPADDCTITNMSGGVLRARLTPIPVIAGSKVQFVELSGGIGDSGVCSVFVDFQAVATADFFKFAVMDGSRAVVEINYGHANLTNYRIVINLEDGSSHYYRIPGVTESWTNAALSSASEDVLREPVLLIFETFQFESEQLAIEQMEAAGIWFAAYWNAVLENPADNIREVSMGRIGDDTYGWLIGGIDGALSLVTVIRIGSVVQVTEAIAITGDITDWMGDFLEEFVEDVAPSSALEAIPTIRDLPRGWSLLTDEATETSHLVIFEDHLAGTPVATKLSKV